MIAWPVLKLPILCFLKIMFLACYAFYLIVTVEGGRTEGNNMQQVVVVAVVITRLASKC